MEPTQQPATIAIESYLSHLRALPFVKKLQVLAANAAAPYYDATLEIAAPTPTSSWPN